MSELAKRATIYLDSLIHKILKLKSVETDQTISDIVNDALRHELAEDQEDLDAFKKRAKEPSISYEVLLQHRKL